MRCPRPKCQSPDLRVVNVYKETSPGLPHDLVGLNITYRTHVCQECGERFRSIQMLQDDFDELRKPARLEPVVGRSQLRPTKPPKQPPAPQFRIGVR